MDGTTPPSETKSNSGLRCSVLLGCEASGMFAWVLVQGALVAVHTTLARRLLPTQNDAFALVRAEAKSSKATAQLKPRRPTAGKVSPIAWDVTVWLVRGWNGNAVDAGLVPKLILGMEVP
mmetsp:Transcript_64774/g.163063  ORF Transcript_64774/g.163063 Transcript_64774/m.163063 type:complete len:120 (+) Transcript_64774:794-1153(+)